MRSAHEQFGAVHPDYRMARPCPRYRVERSLRQRLDQAKRWRGRSGRVVEKAPTVIGAGQQADVVAAEPAIAVAGDVAVAPVAQGPGNPLQQAQPAPGRGQLRHQADEGCGAQGQALAFDQHHAVELFGGQPGPRQQGLALGRLHRGQADPPLGVMGDDEAHRGVAQLADNRE